MPENGQTPTGQPPAKNAHGTRRAGTTLTTRSPGHRVSTSTSLPRAAGVACCHKAPPEHPADSPPFHMQRFHLHESPSRAWAARAADAGKPLTTLTANSSTSYTGLANARMKANSDLQGLKCPSAFLQTDSYSPVAQLLRPQRTQPHNPNPSRTVLTSRASPSVRCGDISYQHSAVTSEPEITTL